MGMNQTPASERVHIGFFGKRNAGKSSVMNKVTGQDLAVVSDIKGTTTDPVYKSMELLPLGPVVMMDTPGIDDEGELGSLRVKKSYQVLNKTDAAVLVIDGKAGISREDQALLERIRKKNIPSILVLNKRDTLTEEEVCQTLAGLPKGYEEGRDFLWVSAREGTGIQELKERLAILAKPEENQKKIIGDLLSPGDFVVLVVPIDKAAPKGRLILPQQQTIRDILDSNGISVVVKEDRLKETLKAFDASQYGGAPLLGLKGLVVKTHGNSKALEVKNSILQCLTFQEQKINEKIQESLQVSQDSSEKI